MRSSSCSRRRSSLTVVSTDLSHGLDWSEASRVDAETARAVEELRWEDLQPKAACGRDALRGLLALARVDRALFDKTGTLTLGSPRIAGVEPAAHHPAPLERSEVLAVAAALERFSAHPLAAAFASIEAPPAEQVTETEGQGISGRIGGRSQRNSRSLLPIRPLGAGWRRRDTIRYCWLGR